MIKYPKIHRWGHEDVEILKQYPNDEIVIEEKVDGGNGSFFVDDTDGTLRFCSRNRDLTAEQDEKTFAPYRDWLGDTLLEALDMDGQSVNDAYVYYVEWMQPHTIRYKDQPMVLGLDIRVKNTMDGGPGMFLTREAKEKEFERLGIPVVPLIKKETMGKLMKEDIQKLIPQSAFYDGKAEGIVLKNYTRNGRRGHQVFAKVVCDMFKEQNKATFGGGKKMRTETDKLIEEFFTEARIKKQIQRLINEEGLALDRTLMKVLPNKVIKDVLHEEFYGIYRNYKYIDFKTLKQGVPKLCLKIVDMMMDERMKE